MDSESESKLKSLLSQLVSRDNTDSEDLSLMIQVISFVSSMDLESQPKPETELMSLIGQSISVFNSMDIDSQPEPLPEVISLFSRKLSLVNSVDMDSGTKSDSEFMSLVDETIKLESKVELISIIHQIHSLVTSKDSDEPKPDSDTDDMKLFSLIHERQTFADAEQDPELKLLSLISQLTCLAVDAMDPESIFISLIVEIISLVSSMNFELQLKPESELMFLVSQAVYVFNSMDLDSQPEPLLEFISLITQKISLQNSEDSDSQREQDSKLTSLFVEIRSLKPEPELISLIHQIISLVVSLNSASGEHLFLCPQIDVRLDRGKFHVTGEDKRGKNNSWSCHPRFWVEISLQEWKLATHFLCRSCFGKNHKFNRLPVEIKHTLHQKHPLELVLLNEGSTRECNCCEEGLKEVFYYCWVCDYAMNVACVEKQPLLSIDHPKWHEHALPLFPRKSSLTCNLCALSDSSSPLYICLPCDFVAHHSCNNLPHIIRISRHHHRISFKHSFDRGDWLCSICRKDINNIYGGYSCIKDGCSYAAHSRCATQRNVWDGIELEGVEEEIEEELEPFVTISEGIIQHFAHQQHYLRLDGDTRRDYEDPKQCQACITPIYSGKFYSCLQCGFILHEECASLSRKIHCPIHPHLLTLVGGIDGVPNYNEGDCSACPSVCTSGFFYECGKEECLGFKLHVQCATLSEPLVHGSHPHPLFLTSKPEEQRRCSVCKEEDKVKGTNDTFNCIKGECDFALCFECATLPQTMRYEHDKHTLILSYGEETSTMTYWCEVCEEKVNPEERFYKCEEYCCVTVHIKCLVGDDLYFKLGSSLLFKGRKLDVVPNKHMSRPFCCGCERRCPYKIVFRGSSRLIFCSKLCILMVDVMFL